MAEDIGKTIRKGIVVSFLPSLVPRQREKRKSGLVSIVRACARIYGIGSVNVSVNGLSHMPRSSTETAYGIVSERTKK